MDRLEEFDKLNPYILWIFAGNALAWMITAMPMMITAFIVGQCSPPDANCTLAPGSLSDEFNLTGSSRYLANVATSMYLFGNMLGASTVARLADLFGRRPLIVGNVFMLGVIGCASAASTSIYMFIVLRFLQGVFFPGCGIVSWVLAYESVGRFWREYAALVFGMAWVVGYCAVAPIAQLLPYWRHISLAASVPSILLGLLYFCAMPESFHFLVSKGRTEELGRWLGRLNRFKPETEVTAEVGAAIGQRHGVARPLQQLIAEHLKQQQTDETHDKNFFVQLLAHKRLLMYTAIFTYLWLSDVLIYYGLSLFSTQLAGDAHWNYVLSGLVEVPSYACSPYLLRKVGRRLFVAGAHFLAAASFLGIMFVGNPTVSLVLWLIGKFGISCAFTCLFVYASEVFPTNLRSGCIGVCEILARLGGVFAPEKALYANLHMIFFATVSFVGGAATLALPETRGQNLPDTTAEAENRIFHDARRRSQTQAVGPTNTVLTTAAADD